MGRRRNEGGDEEVPATEAQIERKHPAVAAAVGIGPQKRPARGRTSREALADRLGLTAAGDLELFRAALAELSKLDRRVHGGEWQRRIR